MDSSKLTEIIVKSQEELDDIPIDFKGQIYIVSGDSFSRIVIYKMYHRPVIVLENCSVVAWENSTVEACGNSFVKEIAVYELIIRRNKNV